MSQMLTADQARACGIGEGPNCCAYLMSGARGFECGRTRPEMKALAEKRVTEGKMNSVRLPQLPFPECQEEGWSHVD